MTTSPMPFCAPNIESFYKKTKNAGTAFIPALKPSGKRGSNPRPSAWEADALPTELFPQVPSIDEGTANITNFIVIAKILSYFGRQICLLVHEPLYTALRSLGKRLKTEFV